MAATHHKELFLGWYLITLKLRETVESRLPKKSTYGGEIVPDYELRPSKSEWVISIEKKLEQGRQDNVPGSWAELSIYRIPRNLMHGEDKAWVPQIVSLGPYHHCDEHLRHMERHKWRCLHRILKRSGQGIDLYLDSVKKVEQRARACYEGRISMSHEEFVEMMVLDGCFVIEMFQGFAKGFENLGYPCNDPIFSMQGSIFEIQRDMIMLENQIPLFLLDQLLGLQLNDPNQKKCVAKLAIQFFSPLLPNSLSREMRGLEFDPLYDHGKVHCLVHCLEVFRRSLMHLGPKRPKTKPWSHCRLRFPYCLTKLREARIKIKLSRVSFLGDIKFKDGILKIPSLEIHEGTRSLFLNLIAFEQSHFNCNHYITSYIFFMRDLINSPEDVLHLHDCHIIEHCLGSNAQVADLFHQLSQEVAANTHDNYLLNLTCDLLLYYGGLYKLNYNGPTSCTSHTFYTEMRFILAVLWGLSGALLTRKWNAWVAILKNKYFDSPWSIISLIAGFILLVLTFIQAFYAVYGYYRPRS